MFKFGERMTSIKILILNDYFSWGEWEIILGNYFIESVNLSKVDLIISHKNLSLYLILMYSYLDLNSKQANGWRFIWIFEPKSRTANFIRWWLTTIFFKLNEIFKLYLEVQPRHQNLEVEVHQAVYLGHHLQLLLHLDLKVSITVFKEKHIKSKLNFLII